MAATGSERYVRLLLLSYEGGKWISTRILEKELSRQRYSPDINTFLRGKKECLDQKKNRLELTTEHYKILYPTDGSDTNVADWNLDLLIHVILWLFNLENEEVSYLIEIQRIKNKIICDTQQASIGEEEFLENWSELNCCIIGLSAGIDRGTVLQATKIIGDLRKSPLSLQHSLEKLHHLCDNDVNMKHVIARIQILEQRQGTSAMGAASADTKLDDQRSRINDIHEMVNRVDSTDTCEIDIPNLQSQLCISGDRAENVKPVEEFVFRALQAAIDKVDDPTDEGKIQCAMREIIENIEKQDALVVSAEKGSILINIKCNTLTGLRKLLTWLKKKECTPCLKNIEAALERKFQFKINVDLVLSNDTVLKFSDWSAKLPYKGKVNIGVKCQSPKDISKVVEYLTYEDAANILDTLSATLSNAVGVRIGIQLEKKKMLTDSKITVTNMSTGQVQASSPKEGGFKITRVEDVDVHEMVNRVDSTETCEIDIPNGPLSNPLSGLPGASSDPFGLGNAPGLGAPNMPPRMPAMQPPHPRTTPPLKSDLPDGLSTLDPKWTELYLQALREGKEKQRNIRVMILGHEGVGKTTLARNLMNKPIQGVETTNGIEVHVRTVLVEVDGTWKESDTASKNAEVGERIARIIEPVKKKAKHAETENIPKEISPPELIYSRTSYPSSADAITEASTLIMENELPQDSEKALDTAIPTQVSILHEVKKKDISIAGQTMVKQLMMVNEKQHDTNPDTTVSVWDFGGHFIFYATHQIFLSSGAIYLLVLDLSKGFDDMIDDGCPITCRGAKRGTVQDSIKFWMHSIHTFASSETGEPPVILVGTHRDKIDEQEISKEDHAENYFENIRKLFDKTPLLHHIQPQQFFLDNLGPEKNSFTKLRSRVMATAAEQSSFNKEIPAKWIPLEQALCQIENKPYITFSEVLEMDSKSDVPIADVEVIRLFLMHHHFQGLLVYFNEEELQDYIILKPQWIIDAFKCIITSWRVFNKKPNLREMWQDFENTAVLKNNLIEEVWQRNDETDFLADKELLLKFLVRLGIMSRGRAYHEDTGKVEELDNFLVPSFLPVQRDEIDMERLLVNAIPTQMVFVFKFEHSYIYPTEHSYISPTIYHRITAAAVGKWPVEYHGTQLLYGDIGMYRLDTPHVGIVRLTDRTIELSVHNLCGKSVDCDIADSFRRFITRAIKEELSRFHCGKETQITTTFRCSCSKRGTEKEHVNTEELKGNDSLPCPVKLSAHNINGKRSYREWFVDADAFVQIDSQVLQKKLGDREIGRISKAIGLNWKLLGMDLGIPKVELERIKMDHPYSSAVQIRYMLQTWKERAVGEATMQALYDKMKDNPKVSIDWDRIKDVIDIL